jgi:hypothetical protein
VTIYTIHAMPVGAPALRLIPYGFSWRAFLLGPAWLLANRLWLAAAVALGWDAAVIAAGVAGLVAPAAVVAALALGAALIGLEGNEWVRRRAMRLGAALSGVALGANETEAMLHASIGDRAPAEARS